MRKNQIEKLRQEIDRGKSKGVTDHNLLTLTVREAKEILKLYDELVVNTKLLGMARETYQKRESL